MTLEQTEVEALNDHFTHLAEMQAIAEEIVKRKFGVAADPMLNLKRVQTLMHAYAIERHGVYTAHHSAPSVVLAQMQPMPEGGTPGGKPS